MQKIMFHHHMHQKHMNNLNKRIRKVFTLEENDKIVKHLLNTKEPYILKKEKEEQKVIKYIKWFLNKKIINKNIKLFLYIKITWQRNYQLFFLADM